MNLNLKDLYLHFDYYMQAVIFYITHPFIWLFSQLPLRVLYFISDYLIYPLLYKVVGYRVKVVRTNLSNSFPEKSEAEKKDIESKFYHYLSDLFVETLKSFSISNKELLDRVSYQNKELLFDYINKYDRFILTLGHVGNYEWLGLQYPIFTDSVLAGPYRRLNNPYFDRYFTKSRGRTGLVLFHTYHTPEMLEKLISEDKKFALVLVNDQSAPPHRAYWDRFLNQDTPFYVGTEKIAREYDLPVLFMNIQVRARGFYNVIISPIVDKPKEEPIGFILKEHVRKVEQNILQAPQYWLWSHKRWKYEKPEVNPSGFGKDSGFF